jgi:hypothetical protein
MPIPRTRSGEYTGAPLNRMAGFLMGHRRFTGVNYANLCLFFACLTGYFSFYSLFKNNFRPLPGFLHGFSTFFRLSFSAIIHLNN